MFLRSLIVADGGTIIREIQFARGLNLIIDETSPDLVKESGNNVGKTTVLRLVSYCFGAGAKKIYADPEFKDKEDPAVKNFLENSDVIIQLRIAQNLDFDMSDDVVIERNFLKRGQKIQRINGNDYNDRDFQTELKRVIFDSGIKYPTVKQIVAKNIREGSLRTENCVKVLNPYASQTDYETLYLFWLGIETPDSLEKGRLEKERRIEEGLLRRLDKEATESQIGQALKVLEREIAGLEEKRAAFNVNPDYEADLKLMDEIRQQIAFESSRKGMLEMKQQLLQKSIQEAQREQSLLNTETVQNLYREAKALIPAIQRTFEETLNFHNMMMRARISFLEQDIPKLDEQIDYANSFLAINRKTEAEIAQKLRISGTYEMMEDVITELNAAHEKRGHYESSRELRTSTQARLQSIGAALNSINADISSNKDLIEQRIASFNKFFAGRSYAMYGEHFILSSDWNSGKLSLEITSVSENLGMGKKLGQIALFDLSYIAFADAEGIPCLHFIMQDRVEAVHDNQLLTLADIIRDTNCQYVLTALKEKLPKEFIQSGEIVLELSQEDKLFKIL